ncbi:hypothetical protein [Synechocystis sp. PCC 7509]|uniref:hypothetical protein n=1 Tax=Synechocystis sp. PCC 7509 TaxID=927677 RepID=UPI000315DD85|nr:hypothetical protein [Synechocystis sp. PCC 7509]
MQSKKFTNPAVFTTPTPLFYKFFAPVISLVAEGLIELTYHSFKPIRFNLLIAGQDLKMLMSAN